MADLGPTPGAAAGQAVAQLLAATLMAQKAATQGIDAQTAALADGEISRKAHDAYAPIFRELLLSEVELKDIPEPLRALIGETTGSIADVTGNVLSNAFFTMLGFGLAAALEPFAQVLRNQLWPILPVAPLSPDAAAAAVQQGVWSQDKGASEAKTSGIDPDRFDVLFRLAGNPPGPETLVALLNRGAIDEGTFRRGIAEGRTKTKYTDALLALREALLSADSLANMVVQNVRPEGEARADAARQGISADDFADMVAVRGNPIATGQALELLNRGEMTEAQVRQVVAESATKTKYTADVLKLRKRLMPMDNIRMSVRDGALTDREGISKLMELGFDSDDAATLIAQAHAQKTEKTRDLALSQILTLFESRYISEAEARSVLTAMGFADDDQALLLQFANARRLQSFLGSAITRVRSRYVAHRLTRPEASGILDQLGIPPGARDDFLATWTLERQAQIAFLTPTQIANAAQKGFMPPRQALLELVALGYQADDAVILLQLHKVESNPADVAFAGTTFQQQ